jgi:two-component system response regulator RegX3
MDAYTLVVVARSQSLAKRLRGALGAEQYLIRWAPSTVQALALDLSDVSLLILEMPVSGGARNVARLKHSFEAPLLALLRAGQPAVEGVDASLSRPYHLDDLVDLIGVTLISHSSDTIRAGEMWLDTETRRLQLNGIVHQLRPIGCNIMALLMDRAGSVVSRDDLYQHVWQTEDGDDTRALDVHIAHLRRQIEVDPRQPKLILTERGTGYRLDPPTI